MTHKETIEFTKFYNLPDPDDIQKYLPTIDTRRFDAIFTFDDNIKRRVSFFPFLSSNGEDKVFVVSGDLLRIAEFDTCYNVYAETTDDIKDKRTWYILFMENYNFMKLNYNKSKS